MTFATVSLSMYSQQTVQLAPDNIDEVISQMTLEEKATLCCGVGTFFRDNGQGIAGATGGVAGLQRFGFPQTYLADGPSGLRIKEKRKGSDLTYPITSFPSPILMASSWDLEAAEAMGAAIGEECKEYNIASILAPGMNILRFPLSGRTAEYFTEDPLLNGWMATAYTRGVQSVGVGTSLKHFAVNNQETARKINNAIVSERALREIYMRGFEIAVKEAQPWTVMSAYNKINGTYASENHWLLEDVLRDEWGFRGLVMSDWDAGMDGVKQVAAGNDICEPGYAMQRDSIVAAVKNGRMPVSTLDRSVRRILQYVVKTPAFSNYPFSNKPDLAAHRATARRIAAEGMILLRNNGALPLQAEAKVAVYGNAAYSLSNREKGIQEGLAAAKFEVDKALANEYKTYLGIDTTAQEAQLTEGGMIYTMFKASPNTPEMTLPSFRLRSQAMNNDYAVVVFAQGAGESNDCKPEDFELSAGEKGMLAEVCNAYHEAGKKVVVVLDIAIPIETASWKEGPDAILCAWQSGQERGNAMADVLGGRVNPSGKLTVSFPVKLSDEPAFDNFPMNIDYNWMWAQHGFLGKKRLPTDDEPVKNVHYTEYKEGIYVGYRYFDAKDVAVSYPFGHGLSYTTFRYSNAKIKQVKDGFVARVKVTNTGNCAGREVVQLYVSAPAGTLDKPEKELKGFAKTQLLQPGESEVLTIPVSTYLLSSFDESTKCWVADSGSYTALFAASSTDIREYVKFNMKKEFRESLHSSKLHFDIRR
ncbi:MAG: glycoside hydrolase family 3 N-terminal domain-containing protein [Bacteroides sp.]|nr:glycoside hydrolase family 3 N-terminal domain-containing protein [Bacteroides sp.]